MPGPQLFQSTGIEEQWQAVIGPWLRREAGQAWRDPRPTVILTPGRAESFYLRGRLVEEGISFLGLRFWTPSDARAFLLVENPGLPIPATRAELSLTARAAAEKLLAESGTDELSLKSIVREPGPFLNAYDLLLSAGWEPTREGVTYGRRPAAEMKRMLAGQKITTQAGLHRALRRETGRPLLNHLLVAGFNATHWPLWDLLRAVVNHTEDCTLSLLAPRVFAAETDQLWISSWEETIGASVEVSAANGDQDETPFADWIASYERGGPGKLEKSAVSFIATNDVQTQIESIALQTLGWLRDKSCRRLGIVFPEANALSLGVAARLRELGVPLDDGTGHWQPGFFEQRAWPAWLAVQEEPSVQWLTEWVRACEAEGMPSGAEKENLSAREATFSLDAALGESLVDHLDFLRLYLEESSTIGRAGPAADFLRRRVQLPENGTFPDFLATTRDALETLGWKDHLARIESVAPGWLRQSGWKISRRAFLTWLRESTDSRKRTRGADGNHFYGKVHLLIYAQMTGQTWTHLILTGLNEGRWPRVYEQGAFGSRHELAALNRQGRALNRRGTTQGGQGEGHEVVRDDRGHCLLPLERQELALRDLCAAVEATSAAVCLTALTRDAGRALLPSDFFSHAWQARAGRSLDDAAFRDLARQTAEECRKRRDLLAAPLKEGKSAMQESEATRIAYAARRDPTRPFGRYEFAYAKPPAEPIQLACKKWEEAWRHPSTVWLEKVVGLDSWPEGQLAWPRAVGTWVHRWLTWALRRCAEEGGAENFPRLLRAAIDREPERIRALAERAGLGLYPWWEHVWGQARAIALGLGEPLVPLLRERLFLSEFRLPLNLRAALPEGTSPISLSAGGLISCSSNPAHRPLIRSARTSGPAGAG